MLDRRTLMGLGAAAFVGCRSANGEYFGNTTPPRTRRLVFESGGEAGSLDPAKCMPDIETYVQLALFEGLTSLHPVTSEPMAGLATHYDVTSSGTQFTFYLRGHPSPRGVQLPESSELPEQYCRGRAVETQRRPALWSDGTTITAADFVYAGDIAEACRLALVTDAAVGRAFNIGSGECVTIKEIASLLADTLGVGIEAEVTGECRVGDVRHCFPDISVARSVLGYRPQTPLAAGLKKLVGWLDGRIAVDRVGEARAALAARGLTL